MLEEEVVIVGGGMFVGGLGIMSLGLRDLEVDGTGDVHCCCNEMPGVLDRSSDRSD